MALQLKTHRPLTDNVLWPSRLHVGGRIFQYSLPVMVLMNDIVNEALKLWSNSVFEDDDDTALPSPNLLKAYYKPYYMIGATFETLPEAL